ncbi:MAG: DUF192 domain-containing protein [Candidatus Harrisonbacteria bacterium]|nr:DUF192 domain-containing protein [Candidatus Harrisonbacteria bacterium]
MEALDKIIGPLVIGIIILFIIIYSSGALNNLVIFLLRPHYLRREVAPDGAVSYTYDKAASSSVAINNHLIRVTLAETSFSRSKGLSGHAPLASDEGMLFLFPRATIQSFWMKDMLFPLDIIWLQSVSAKEAKIIGVAKNAQPLKSLLNLEYFTSPAPVDWVLEVSAGTFDSLKMKVGDSATFSR